MEEEQQQKKSIYEDIPESRPVVLYVRGRYNRNQGTNIFVVGGVGLGKSSQCQRLGELIQQDNLEKNLKIWIVNSFEELCLAVQQAKPGDIIIIEEVSVLFSSRRSMSGDNVGMGFVYDTIRSKRLCLISNCPVWNSVDSHMRSMGNVLIVAFHIDREEGVVLSKLYKLDPNPVSGRIYTPRMKYKGELVDYIYTRMPNLDIWKEYELTKKEKFDELIQEQLFKARKRKEKAKSERKLDKEEIIEDVRQNINKSSIELAKSNDVSERTIQRIRRDLGGKPKTTKK